MAWGPWTWRVTFPIGAISMTRPIRRPSAPSVRSSRRITRGVRAQRHAWCPARRRSPRRARGARWSSAWSLWPAWPPRPRTVCSAAWERSRERSGLRIPTVTRPSQRYGCATRSQRAHGQRARARQRHQHSGGSPLPPGRGRDQADHHQHRPCVRGVRQRDPGRSVRSRAVAGVPRGAPTAGTPTARGPTLTPRARTPAGRYGKASQTLSPGEKLLVSSRSRALPPTATPDSCCIRIKMRRIFGRPSHHSG